MKMPGSSWILLSLGLLIVLIAVSSLGSWNNIIMLGPGDEVSLPPPYRGYLIVASPLIDDGGFRIAGKVFVGAAGIPKAVYMAPSPLPTGKVKLSSETYMLVYISSTGPYLILIVALAIAGASLLVEYRYRRRIVALLVFTVIILSIATVFYSWYYWTTPTFAEAHTLLSAAYKYMLEPGDYKMVVAARGLVLLETLTGNITLNNSTIVLDIHASESTNITAYNLAPGVSAPLLHIFVWRSWSPPDPSILSWTTLVLSLASLGVASRLAPQEQSSLIGEEAEE